jgi:hypothetical protein
MIYQWRLADFGQNSDITQPGAGFFLSMWRLNSHGRKINRLEGFESLEALNRRLERFILVECD